MRYVCAVTRKGNTRSVAKTAGGRSAERGPCLFLEIECERPLAGPARFGLHQSAVVRIGRGAERAARLDRGGLDVLVPDDAVSVEHASLSRVGGRWKVRDLGSRNGTFLNSERIEEEEVLSDGAMLQLGSTFFRFRAARENVEPLILDSSELRPGPTGIPTFSPRFADVLRRAAAIAPTRVPVLLHGESGTGKEVLARTIHNLSGRSGEFVAVNSGAIPTNLVEAELFGYRKGAFSGAERDHPGLVRASNGGTLFLDEIGDLPIAAQAAFLRVLQESEVLQVGSIRPQRLDLRVVAATHQDLERLVADRSFRHDLLARLDGVRLEIPSLWKRSEDVPLLIATLLKKLAPECPRARFSPAAGEALLAHQWPLNIRELEQTLAGALALSEGGTIELEHLPRALRGSPRGTPKRELTSQEKDHCEELVGLLRSHQGNLNAIARILGKGRTQVVRWIHRYGIDLADFRIR